MKNNLHLAESLFTPNQWFHKTASASIADRTSTQHVCRAPPCGVKWYYLGVLGKRQPICGDFGPI